LSRLLIYTILTVDKRQFRKGKYIFQLRIDKYSNYGNYNKGEGTHLCMKKIWMKDTKLKQICKPVK
jgi:hypothetical protein